MTGKKLQRLLACLLAVLLLSQVGAFSPAVFAVDSSGYTLHDGTAVIPAGTSKEDVDRILAAALVVGFDQMSGEEQDRILTGEWQYACEGKSAISTKNTAWGPVTGFDSSKKVGPVTTKYSHPALAANEDDSYPIRLKLADGTLTNEVKVYKAQKPVSSITLKEGVTVTLPYNADVSINFDALRERIFDQVVESTTPELTVNDVTIQYYAKTPSGLSHEWAPLEGEKVGLSKYPAISEGDQQIRISYAGNDTYGAASAEVTVTFADREASNIVLKPDQQVALPYTDATTVDYDALRVAILQQVVSEDTTPALTTENTEIKYKFTKDTWVDLAGGKIAPAVSAKSYEIQISFKGDDTYKASSATTTVTFTERPTMKVELKPDPTFKLAFTADGKAIYDNIQQQVFDAVIQSNELGLTANDMTIEYYATAKTGVAKSWMPLEGGTKDLLTYPAIGEGTQEVRITWGGSKDYAAWQWKGNVDVTGRADAPFRLKEGVTEGMTVAMVYNRDQSINYEATAQALRDALLESTDPNISIDDVTVQYNAGIKNYQPLNYSPTGSDFIDQLVKFGLGSQTIHFAWNGNADYKPLKLDDVKVNMEDHRIASAVVLKSGASITYNMDAKVMLQAIFENLIDWDASTLPSKGTLSVADFTIEYYAENEVEIDGMTTGGGAHLYMPLEGGKGGAFEGDLVKSLTYPQMGAGDQKIRVTFKGDEAYRPSTPIEGNLTVNKAKVSVKVHSTSIYAEETKNKLGEGFVTTDPADKFDIYTIYGGMTSDVTGSVFVQLPERYTNTALIKAIDWALEQAGQPTLTEMMNNGTTVGQLRKILSDVISRGADLPQFIKDALKNANIDIDTLVKLNDALSKLPGLLDNVRVAIGTPNQAGLYVVTAVTNNKNYETGVGTGMLLVKKHYSGVKLQWNQTIPNGKLTAEEAKNFDFGVTLMYDGNPAEKQTNVHYLYSGFTSKWRPYSNTTTPPTEPGRYVVTVVTLGGNYQAAPITRAFQITK